MVTSKSVRQINTTIIFLVIYVAHIEIH